MVGSKAAFHAIAVANLLSRYWLLWSVALQVNRKWWKSVNRHLCRAEVTHWLLRLLRHRVVRGNLFLLPPKVQSHAAKKKKKPHSWTKTSQTGLLGSGSPGIMTGVRTVSGLLKAWDSDKTHMAQVQESCCFWVTEQITDMMWNLKVLLNPTFMWSYRKERPVLTLPCVPSQIPTCYSFWNNAADNPLSTTVLPDYVTPHPARITLSFLFNIYVSPRRCCAGPHLPKTNTALWYGAYCHLISQRGAPNTFSIWKQPPDNKV